MDEGYHRPLEEYLETIFSLGAEGTEVIGAQIAESLGRSAPSVKEMLDRLEEDGYVTRQGRTVSLTERGHGVAVTVTRRHRLAERLLVDVIGLEWHKVHDEAGKWEHVISADVEEKLIALLGDPSTCPHGNPIPGSHGGVSRAERSLAGSQEGQEVILLRINEMIEHDETTLMAMDAAGFIPGQRGVVSARNNDGSIEITAAKGSLRLSKAVVSGLFIAA